MKPLCLIFAVFCICLAQEAPRLPDRNDQGPKLPNGRSQRNAIAKDDYKKNLEDARAMVKLAEDLKADLEKEEAFVVSVRDMKMTEEIEKLARNIRSRMKRY